MFAKLEKVMGATAEKVGNNKVLVAIRDGFLYTTPLIIVASFFIIVGNFPLPGYDDFMTGLLGDHWTRQLDAIIDATYGVLALLAAAGVGAAYARQLDDDATTGSILSVVCYLVLSPKRHLEFVNADGRPFNGYAVSHLGTSGLFLGMLAALLAVYLFVRIKRKGWVIKMPDGVPPAVAQSFEALIPSLVVLLAFFGIYLVFFITPYQYTQFFIYDILQKPLLAMGRSYFLEPVIQAISTTFWFFGINGPAITNSVFNPMWLSLSAENLTAFQNGEPLPNLITGTFSSFFTNFGGGGSTLALVVLMLFVARSQRMKQLGRLAIVPGIFGINEMIIFGVPMVLNPVMLVPFIATPLINTILSIAVTAIGLIPRTTGANLPWTTPPFFSGWLSTGSIVAGLYQLLLIALDCLIYYPFFKALDRQYAAEEAAGTTTKTDDLDEVSLDDLSFDDL